MSLKAKDAPERIYIDMERMHDFSDASRAIVSTEHATNPTENDVLYVRAAFMEEVREVLGNLTALAAPHFSDDTQMLALAQARALLEKMEGR